MEQKSIQVNPTDWLTFFKLPPIPKNPLEGWLYFNPTVTNAPLPIATKDCLITAPEEIKDKPDLYQPEYLGNAEPVYYDNARLLEFLFKSPARFFRATSSDFAFQDYRKPLVFSGINCNISNPGFSFLTIAETVGVADAKLSDYGLILFKYIGRPTNQIRK